MSRRRTKRRPPAPQRQAPAEAPPRVWPNMFLPTEVQLDPTPEELIERGEFDPQDFCPGGKWDPLRPRPRFRPAWWHRWKNGARIW